MPNIKKDVSQQVYTSKASTMQSWIQYDTQKNSSFVINREIYSKVSNCIKQNQVNKLNSPSKLRISVQDKKNIKTFPLSLLCQMIGEKHMVSMIHSHSFIFGKFIVFFLGKVDLTARLSAINFTLLTTASSLTKCLQNRDLSKHV